MFMVNIDVNSGDWQKRNKFMYYSPEKRTSYCIECDFTTTSPRISRIHADEHNLSLPYSRKKNVVELVPVTQHKEETLTPRKENYETYRSQSYVPNQNSTYGQNSSTNFVPITPLGREIWKRRENRISIDTMRISGCYSDEEIEEQEIKFGLKQKEDTSKNEYMKNEAIMILQKRFFNEDDPDMQDQIIFTMGLIEQEKDSKNIPILLSTLPRPKPKRDKFAEEVLLMLVDKYLERKEKESDLLDSAEKFLEIMQMLRKKPNHDERPNETETPPVLAMMD